MILAMYDVSGIQEYIFQSSRMKENVGASRIVGDVLKVHLRDVLMRQYADDAGERVVCEWSLQNEFSILTNSAVMIEVVYIGGGNALIAFRSIDDYNEVNEKLAKRLLEVSHTLYLAVAAIESDAGSFIADKSRLEERMAAVKAQMLRPKPPGAFPVSEQEAQSGLPITDYSHVVKSNVSRLQRLKQEAIPKEDKQEPIKFPDNQFGFQTWAFQMDDLIRERDKDSFVAIIHIDGNGMGKQLREKQRELKMPAYSDEVQKIRQWSRQISSGYSDVFAETIVSLLEAQPTDCWNRPAPQLPIRPLIMDGDDLTIVCLGAWGVPLAARLLENLEKASCNKKADDLSLSACAGVVLVHSHFPFHLGYAAAEECCKRAKKQRIAEGGDGAYVGFEIVRGSNPKQSNLEHLQERPYRISDSKHSTSDHSSSSRQAQPDDFSTLAACIAKIADSDWPNSRLERLHAALLGDSEQRRLYLQECKSRGYTLEQLLLKVTNGCLEADDISNAGRRLLLDALDLYRMFDRKVWTWGKEEMG